MGSAVLNRDIIAPCASAVSPSETGASSAVGSASSGGASSGSISSRGTSWLSCCTSSVSPTVASVASSAGASSTGSADCSSTGISATSGSFGLRLKSLRKKLAMAVKIFLKNLPIFLKKLTMARIMRLNRPGFSPVPSTVGSSASGASSAGASGCCSSAIRDSSCHCR